MKNLRMNHVIEEMKIFGIRQLLITDPLSVYYLTDVWVEPMERFLGLYIHEDGRKVLFLNTLFVVPENTDIQKVRYSDTDCVAEVLEAYIDKNEVLGVDKDLKARLLLQMIDRRSAKGFVDGSPAVDLARAIKNADEIEVMRRASEINDQAMERFKGLIHASVTEAEVNDQMLQIYLDLGAEGFSFAPIVSFGKNAADPHHVPDNTLLQEGDCVLFDVGCKYKGYCSDMTRTFFYRYVSDENRKIYEIVRSANESAEKKIKPAASLKDIDREARDLISAFGYGREFNHRLGHFIGMSVHEYGDVSAASEWKAEPGMIFSIEPGIYLAGQTGVRIEDLVLVTENGVEILNHYTKELQIIK